MASAEILDFAALLAPIPGDQPAGTDIRTDWSPTSTYYSIKDGGPTRERSNVACCKIPKGTIPGLIESGTRTGSQDLTEMSKDLEIAAWYTEALVQTWYFSGLRDGFRLCRELVVNFWDHLYPLPDEEDGLEVRVASLTGLNGDDGEGTLIGPIANVPLTGGVTVGPFSAWHYEQAGALEQIDDPSKRDERISQGATSLQMIDQAVMETQPEFFHNLLEDIEQAENEFACLCEVLEEKCGTRHAPPSSNIRNAISGCRDVLQSVAKDVLQTVVEEEDALDSLDSDGVTNAALAERGAPRKVMTRDDAFRTLLQVAEFFRKTEPHTPISFLLEQAVRWGKMPLPELLVELIPDESSRDQLFKLVGIRLPENPE